ncbi:unnamed protein product [Dracunculus medinensis]|uniref:Transthyretin-like family protein n=1 Tax=Dracunculus medinensis TaxID=318479 RepID=A0A0N4UA58_DRAME|nr:unnamed protein product [Dracunculus medinensis]
MKRLFSIAVFVRVSSAFFCCLQNITVRGQFACNRTAIANVSVQLWDEDSYFSLNILVDPDDFLNSTTSDSAGFFNIYGETVELSTMDPYLIISHNCLEGKIEEKCIFKESFTIPEKFIGRIYDMAIVSLNIARRHHKELCINSLD